MAETNNGADVAKKSKGWFKGLKAARLLVGKAVSPPGQLLVLSCLSTGANRLVSPSVNKLEGFQNDICQYQCLCGRTSSQKWLPECL